MLSSTTGNFFTSTFGSLDLTAHKIQLYLASLYRSIIQKVKFGITLHQIVTSSTSRTTTFDPGAYDHIDAIPEDYIPVDVYSNEDTITAHHNKICIKVPATQQVPTITNIDDAIRHSSDWKRQLIQHYRIHDLQLMIDSIHNSTKEQPMIIVTDGGLQDEIGSFGVAIGTKTQELCSIEGPVLGNPSMLTSFRSEAYGMLAGLTFLNLFITSHDIIAATPKHIFLYCDNLPLVTIIQQIIEGAHYPRMYLKSESDIILQIRDELQTLRNNQIIVNLHHVKVHQDDNVPYHALPREAQLNVDADTYATNYLQQKGPQYDYEDFPANALTITLNYELLTRDLKRHIRKASRSPDLRKYMIKKFSWKESTPDLVWWQIHGSSIQSYSRNDRRRLRKFIFSWLPTGERLNIYDNTVSAICPSCQAVETHDHVLQCACVKRAIIKDTWDAQLKEFLSGDKYSPLLVNQMLYHYIIKHCSLTSTTILPTDLPSNIQLAYDDQALIGWKQLLRGRLAFRWGTIVANHLDKNKVSEKEMTALTWGRQLVKLMFQMVLDVWMCRNNIAHQPNERNESKLSRKRILAKIEALQQSNPEVQFCDQHFVFQPLEILKTYSLCNLFSWHRQAVSIVQRQKKYTQTQPDIRTVFRTLNSNPAHSLPLPAPNPE